MDSRTDFGSEFHSVGPAMLKALSPYFKLERAIARRVESSVDLVPVEENVDELRRTSMAEIGLGSLMERVV